MTDKTETILEGIKSELQKKKNEVKETEGIREEVEIKTSEDISAVDSNILEQWMMQEQENAEVIPLIPPKLNLIFLPLLLSEAIFPSKKTTGLYMRKYGSMTIQIRSGSFPNGEDIGLPYGLMARRLMIALITRSVKDQSRVIRCGSIHKLMNEAGLGISGQSYRAMQRMLLQLATMHINVWFVPEGSTKGVLYQGQMFDTVAVDVEETAQINFKFVPDTIVLSEDFYNEVVKDKAVPFLAETIKKATSPLEHDILIWLLHRTPRLDGRTEISWSGVYNQFATPGMCHRQFKVRVKKALGKIKRDVGIEVTHSKKGICISHTKAQVPLKGDGWWKPLR